jgi:hypothetical protein
MGRALWQAILVVDMMVNYGSLVNTIYFWQKNSYLWVFGVSCDEFLEYALDNQRCYYWDGNKKPNLVQ